MIISIYQLTSMTKKMISMTNIQSTNTSIYRLFDLEFFPHTQSLIFHYQQ